MRLAALGDDIITDPLYDPDKVETGLSPGCDPLYMPDSAKNPMSQQGTVVAVGPQQKDVEPGDHILYHPFIAFPFKVDGREYLKVRYSHCVGWLDPYGELYPLPDYVALLPDFKTAGRPEREGSLWVPKQLYHPDIPCTGVITRVGGRVRSVRPGQRVIFPYDVGNEIGLRRVWYTIRASDLLAVVGADVDVRITVAPITAPPREPGTTYASSTAG